MDDGLAPQNPIAPEPVDAPPAAAGAPVSPAVDLPWYRVWWMVYSQPGPGVFARLAAGQPGSYPAMVWVAVAAFLATLAPTALRMALLGGGESAMVMMVLEVVLAPVGGVIGLAIGAGAINWVAGRLGGKGSFEATAYLLGAIQAPYLLVLMLVRTLIPTLISLSVGRGLGGAGIVSSSAGLVAIAFILYTFVQQVNAVRGAHGFSTSRALAAILIPIGVVAALALCWSLIVSWQSGGLIGYYQPF